MTVVNSTVLKSSNILISKYQKLDAVLPEIIIEKLMEKRDFYLSTLKHLEFQSIMDPSEKELKDIEKLQANTVEQLKKIEQEIASILSEK